MTAQFLSRSLGPALLILASCTTASAQPADIVLQWNEIAQRTVAAANPFVQSRSMAITQLAVLDAAPAATRTAGNGNAQKKAPAASPEAAVMAAAHEALRALHPESADTLDATLAAGLGTIVDEEARANGISIGRAAADRILEQRKADSFDAKADYTPGSAPGNWVPTPPTYAAALVPHWGQVTPFALKSSAQFRPDAPSAIDSARYLRDLREVFEMGGATSRDRPSELTDAARFWTVSAAQTWNPVARQAGAAAQQAMAESARTLALLNVAIADALIACFDAKYTYNVWRPVTAIHVGVRDIGPDADWLPLIATPPFPAYPSAHACAAGAAREVLERIFGTDGQAIVLTSAAASGVTFRYSSFMAIADHIDDARVYGGIHVREDQEVGRELGRKVGSVVYETLG